MRRPLPLLIDGPHLGRAAATVRHAMTWRQRLVRWFKRLVVLGVVLALAGLATAYGAYRYYERDLPSVDELKTWRPAQVTKVLCKDGKVCAEFYAERRTWVDLREAPKHVREVFLAAEDADFYQHGGLDFLGIARSAVKNLIPGSLKSGASTISQQACRNILLSQERTLARKIREWILTPRMEAALSKDEILNLYVNTIYYGQRRYGVEEAALFYFGKHAKELNLDEAAVIAGTVQSPHRINPVTNIVRAKKRQRYVLTQAWKKGFVPQADAEAAIERPIVLGPRPPPTPVGQSYAEEVRKALVQRYGEGQVQRGGLRVQIAMDPVLQAHAEKAVREGLEAVDRRQGYRGPTGQVPLERFATLRPFLEARLAEAGKRRPDERLVVDLEALKTLEPPQNDPDADPRHERDDVVDAEAPADDDSSERRLARAVSVRPLADGLEVVGLAEVVDDKVGTATIDLVGVKAQLDFKSTQWARRKSGGKLGPAPTKLSDVVAVGDLVRVRLGAALPASEKLAASLAQVPDVQGALVVIDPETRAVLAMVGGYDFADSSFNRATQAKRQPGSSFKPFLYAAAIESGRFTPLTQINDAPEAIRDPWTNKLWKPQNFEKGAFEGPITLRAALTKSKNTVSVRLIEALGPEVVIDFARRAGIASELPQNLTLALGTGEVTVLEEANAYTTLRADGQWAEPQIITQVRDATGKILEEHRPAPEPRIPAPVAAVVTSLMRSVVEEGTATQVQELGRPAAGKTGTAQEYRDAWFSGYTMDFVATAWVGRDDHTPIGTLETGGKAALPLWLNFMKRAHQGLPVRDFPLPEGVVQARVDPSTGRLAGQALPGRLETFVAGTEPSEAAHAPGAVDPNEFLLHDSR